LAASCWSRSATGVAALVLGVGLADADRVGAGWLPPLLHEESVAMTTTAAALRRRARLRSTREVKHGSLRP
jgi:hypothetical protein